MQDHRSRGNYVCMCVRTIKSPTWIYNSNTLIISLSHNVNAWVAIIIRTTAIYAQHNRPQSAPFVSYLRVPVIPRRSFINYFHRFLRMNSCIPLQPRYSANKKHWPTMEWEMKHGKSSFKNLARNRSEINFNGISK